MYVRAYDMHLSSQKKKKAASLAGVIEARGLSVGQDAMSAPCQAPALMADAVGGRATGWKHSAEVCILFQVLGSSLAWN